MRLVHRWSRGGLVSPVLHRLVLLLGVGVQICLASRGDESAQFRLCVRYCLEVDTVRGARDTNETQTQRHELAPKCSDLDDGHVGAWRLPYSWDCDSECKYRCMWAIESNRAESPQKYFGKWPFIRLGPMQEPASVALSLANLAASAHCLVRLLCLLDFNGYGMLKRGQSRHKRQNTKQRRNTTIGCLWLVHFALAVNAWAWSAVFHSRDLRVTERLDYFSAGAVMVFDLYLSIARVSGVSSGAARLGMLGALILAYVRHIFYMHYVKFDYGYHVALCVAVGLAQSLMWICWMVFSKDGGSHPGKRSLWVFVVGINLAVLLEVLDFPPLWYMVDAHALWHASTVPLTYVLWDFVSKDVERRD